MERRVGFKYYGNKNRQKVIRDRRALRKIVLEGKVKNGQ
jgi:hypothetical protein